MLFDELPYTRLCSGQLGGVWSWADEGFTLIVWMYAFNLWADKSVLLCWAV